MEEEQIQHFVHQAINDEDMQRALNVDATGVVSHQECSPRVAQILLRLVPHLAFENPLQSNEKWWHA